MVTNNSINQATEALVVGPIGVVAADATTYLLQVEKDQGSNGATLCLTRNNNSGGRAGYIANTDGGGSVLSGGIYQYGSAYNDSLGANGSTQFFSNAFSTGLNLICTNGTLNVKVGGSYVVQTNWTTTGGQYRGYNSNTAPAAGYIGELISASATTGTLTSLTTVNVTSIALTAGVWDISAHIQFTTTGAVTGNTDWYGAISTVSASLVNLVGEMGNTESGGFAPVNAYNTVDIRVGPTRALLSGNTTIYLNTRGASTVTFTNVTATGIIRAVRVA